MVDMTTVRRAELTLPGAPLGPDNPLPALRTLDLNAQKDCQLHGEPLVHDLGDDDLHQHASDASGAIHTD